MTLRELRSSRWHIYRPTTHNHGQESHLVAYSFQIFNHLRNIRLSARCLGSFQSCSIRLESVQEIDSIPIRPARHCTMLQTDAKVASRIPAREGYQETTQSHFCLLWLWLSVRFSLRDDSAPLNNMRSDRKQYQYPLRDTGGGGSKTSLTKHLLQTLTDDSNPITHSDIGLRSGQFFA